MATAFDMYVDHMTFYLTLVLNRIKMRFKGLAQSRCTCSLGPTIGFETSL